jgi:hypothetical protein
LQFEEIARVFDAGLTWQVLAGHVKQSGEKRPVIGAKKSI